MKNKRLILILTSIAVLMLIPLFVMQFTTELNWTLSDFVIMGILLLTAGLSCELVFRKQSKVKFRIAICLVIIAVFFLTWIQLSVGII